MPNHSDSLEEIAALWPLLPEHVREGILAMIRVAVKR